MNRIQWPLPADVQSWLTIAGAWDVTDDLSDTLQAAIDGAVDTFQENTGWTPFLAADTDSTRYFDAPGARQPSGRTGGGKKLFLDGGLVSLTSLKIDGVLQTAGSDFFLQPYNNETCTKVLFDAGVYCESKGIEIVGRWGYGTVIPEAVWEAVRDKAASRMLASLGNLRRVNSEASQGSQVKAKETGPVRTEYATVDASKTTDFSPLRRMWESSFDLAVTRYLFI